MRHVYVLALAALAACGDDPITELTATAMPVSTAEDTPKAFEIEANLPVTVQVTTAPMHGELTGEGTAWTYTPEANYNGADAVTVLVSAGGDSIDLAIPIMVTAVNDAPVAVADNFPTNADIPLVIDTKTLVANDTDLEGDALAVTAVANAVSGGAVLDGTQITFTPTLGFAGNATFEYTVSDGNASGTGTVTVSVGVDQAPIAVNDSATTVEDTTLNLTTAQLLNNDSDPDGHLISIKDVGNCQPGCTVTKTGTTITVVPAADSNALITFDYTVTDGALDDTGVVSVTVTPVADAPIAGADTAATAEDTPVQIAVGDLLANDSDGDGNTLTITSVTGALLANGIVTFTPVANFNGDATFQYTIADGTGLTATGTVTVTVSPVADVPVAVTDTLTVAEDGSGAVDVFTNDSDADGDTLILQSFTQPAHGVVTFVGSVATYTPVADFTGTDAFTYTISDGNNGTATGTVTVAVTPVNDAPIAIDDTIAVVEETATVMNALANDLDIDGDTLTFVSVTQPSHGTVQLAGGIVTYTPALNYFGPDAFDYVVSDGHGGTDAGHVTIAVSNVNDAPVAKADTLGTDENTAVSSNLVANDTDADGDTLTVQSFTQGTKGGTVAFNGNVATYTPTLNFSDTDTFTYTISDGNGGTSTATVTVFVGLDNDPPVAADDTATVAEETTATISVLGNDSDIDGNTIEVTAVTAPEHGTISLVAGVISYRPSDNYFGPDQFDYVINDGFGGTDIGHVDITVTNVNDTPVAVNDTLTTQEDTFAILNVTLNDTDIDGDTLEIQSATQPAHGTVVIVNGDARYTPATNYNGPDAFTYTVTDGAGGTATATVNVTVTAVNDAPVAGNDNRTAVEETATAIAVLGNDNDVDGDTLTVTAVGAAAHGTVTLVAGAITYTPALNFFGTDAFDYTISDGNGGIDIGRVTVAVTNVNDAPVAANDTLSTNEDTPKSLNVASNDNDVDNDTLTIQSFTQPANGTVTFVGTTATFTPALNFNGTTSFTYTIKDPSNATATATVNITVIAVNDKPDAVNDAITTNEDTQSAQLDLLANDTDVDIGQTLTVTSNTNPAHGTVTRTGGIVRYTPALNYNGPDAFNYTVSDGNGGTDTATVAITVVAVNDAPDAVNDAITTNEDTTSAALNLIGNDSDVDTGQTLTVTSNTNAANGTVTRTGNSVTYTPNNNFNGTDSFTYTISDGNGGTDTATVNINVVAVNDAPDAVNDTITTNEDVTSGSLNLVTNDTDVDTGQTLTVTATSTPANGVVTRTGNSVTYKPNLNFNGSDSFTYTISDGNGGTDTATVNVTVVAVNDAPDAVNDAITTNEDTTSASLNLVTNDTDVDAAQTLTVTSNTNGTNGTVTRTGNSVTYTPNSNFNGSDSFTYTISDGNGGIDTATVNVTVTAVNDAPDAVNDAITTNEDVTSGSLNLVTNDTDVDSGQTLTVTSTSAATNGTVNRSGNSVTYTPNANFNGTDSFTYTISDGNGGTDTATVNVTVTAVPDAPDAVNDAITVAEDDDATTVNVKANDTDADNDTLTVTAVGAASNGTAALTAGVVTYKPNANFNGTDSFTYTINDGTGRSDTATVTVTVTAVPDLPNAVDDAITIAEDAAATTVNVKANDTDADGDTITVTAVGAASNGTAALAAGVVTYKPNANFNGTDQFTYTITANGNTDTATVTVTVTAVNDAPVANNDAFTVPAGTADLDVLANDTDVDTGDTKTLDAITVQPSSGAVTIVNNQAHYVVSTNFSGTVTFTYRVKDSGGLTATAVATITVTAANQPPVADDVSESSNGTSIQITLLGSDPDEDAVTFEIVTQPTVGSISDFDDVAGTLTFNPGGVGTASFTYRVKDAGGLVSAAATVTVSVAGCGDGQVSSDPDVGIEECDDGNTIDGDGCDKNCDWECGSDHDTIFPTAVSVDPDTGHCFAKYSESVNFTGAFERCQVVAFNDGHIPTVRGIGEQDAIAKLLGDQGEGWLGGTDAQTPGNFRWVTGEPFTFQFFQSGQPTNAPGADCLASRSDTWFDSDCDKQFRMICEFNDGGECGDGDVNPGEECDDGNDQNGDGCENDCSFTCGSGTGATLSVAIGTHCFAGYTGTTDFGGAAERCGGLGAHLATAASTEENEGILKIAGILPTGTGWIGAVADGQGEFQWIVDEPFEFRAFAQGEPTFKPNEDCVIATNAGWLDTLCDGSDAGAPGAICEFELQPDPIAPFHDDVFVNLAKYGTLTR